LRKNEGGEEKGLPQSDPLHASVIDQCNHGQKKKKKKKEEKG
jgi:hypothetical protein